MKKGGITLLFLIFTLSGIVITASIGGAISWNSFYNKITGNEVASDGGSVGGSVGSSGGSPVGGSSGGGGGGNSYSSTPKESIIKECIPEGSRGDSLQEDDCCEGVSRLDNSYVSENGCIAPSDGSFICSNCGDGLCSSVENNCNCAQDCCKVGETKKYRCSDGSEVQWCLCSPNSAWSCITSPEGSCPNIEETIATESTENCPVGCICNGNNVVCSTTQKEVSGDEALWPTPINETHLCPVGCICSGETILCEVNQTKGACVMGCELNTACVLPGIRTSVEGRRYCDIDSQWKEQKKGDINCDNNYECETNLCIDGKCLNHGIWQKFLNWIKNIF